VERIESLWLDQRGLAMAYRLASFALLIATVAGVFGHFGRCISPCAADEPPSGGVMPLNFPKQTEPEIAKVQQRLYRLAQHQARYLLATVHPWSENSELKLLTESKSSEHFIRPNTCAVEGFAFLFRFGPYDETTVGVTRKELFTQTIVPMMRYLTATHVTGDRPTSDGRKWGDHWQSAHWAQMLGRAAWWLWEDLPEDLRRDVRRIIVHEAERFVDATPPHNLRNDTKAEENAWNSMIFNAALVLMPDDPRRTKWEDAFQRWTMSAFLRPADEHSARLVDGRPVSDRFTGANIHDDFTLENHGIVHPNYMGTFSLTLGASLECALSGRKPPEALLHNVRELHANLKWFQLPDGGCVFPNGQDWAVFQHPSALKLYVPMAVYAQDPDAWSMVEVCLAVTEKMQARGRDGAIYVPEEIVYRGSQQAIFAELGRCWLMLQTAARIVDAPQPLRGVKRLDSAKIIIHRTPIAIHSVSWGPVVMAQCVPWRMDRVVSPDQRDGVGQVRLKGDKKDLPVKLVSADVQNSADGFTAELVVDHGDAIRANLRFRSNADGSFIIGEKLTALRDATTTEIATGLVGVLNDPFWVYESRRRKIALGDAIAEVPALSGKTLKTKGVRQIDVDGALKIGSTAPLVARYVGTKKIERGRATDKLYFNYLGGERRWAKGQVISTFEATVTPQVETRKD
jgi:hypothetical protein